MTKSNWLEDPQVKETFRKAEKEMRAKTTEQLVGSFFHTFNDEKLVEWQGVVLSSPEPGIYLVQLFEWLGGDASCRKLVRIESMLAWDFYESADAMTFAYDTIYKIRAQKADRKAGNL